MNTGFVQERLKRNRVPIAQIVIKAVAAALVGFVMSGASILSVCSPFGLAWAGAVPGEVALFATVGALAGSALLLERGGGLRYMAALVLFMALRWAFSFLSKERMRLLAPVMAATACLVTGVAATIPGVLMDYVLVGCEALLVATAALLLHKALEAMDSLPLSGSGALCVGLLLSICYMGLAPLTIFKVSVARMAAAWLMMTVAMWGGCGAAAVTGAAAGLAAALSGNPAFLAAWVAGGLAGGIFAPVGRMAAIGAVACGATMGLLASGSTGLVGIHLIELGVGATCAILTKGDKLRQLGLAPAGDGERGELFRRAISLRLRRTSGALGEIAQVTTQVSRRLEELRNDPLEKFVNKAADSVCKGCKDSPRCWQQQYNDTVEALGHAFAEARIGRGLSGEDIPAKISCIKADLMAQTLAGQAARYNSLQASRRHSSRLRSIACEQFEGMAMLIDGIEQEGEQLTPMTAAQEREVTEHLNQLGGQEQSVCCALDPNGRANISVAFPRGRMLRLDIPHTTAELSQRCAQELGLPQQLEGEEHTLVSWTAQAVYKVESAHVQRAADGGRLCGDSVSTMEDVRGSGILLLSDGMGVGSAAAVDSTMTTSLLGRLLKAGCSFEAALKLVNSSLLSWGEERLCTVDAVIVDLFTGRMEAYKAGAAPTFIIRKGRVSVLQSSALPAGILGGAEAKRSVVSLSPGDIIVMVSDGITDTGEEWIPSQLLALCQQPLEGLCNGLLETAIARRLDKREDDMTVLVAVLLDA